MSTLFDAVIKGDIEKVKLLLPISDPSTNNNQAIRYASENGYTEIVKLLLADPRVDPSAAYNYSIRYASENGHTEIVKLLLADPRVDPSTIDNQANDKNISWKDLCGKVKFSLLEML